MLNKRAIQLNQLCRCILFSESANVGSFSILVFGGNVFSRESCQLSLKIDNFCLQKCNSVVYSGQSTIIIVDCSIENLVNVVLKKERSSLMHILQHLYLSLILGHMLSTYAIFDTHIPILSTEIRKGNSSGKVVESQHIYLSN